VLQDVKTGVEVRLLHQDVGLVSVSFVSFVGFVIFASSVIFVGFASIVSFVRLVRLRALVRKAHVAEAPAPEEP
jgi:energy-converting hydrogenase Eha subunit E